MEGTTLKISIAQIDIESGDINQNIEKVKSQISSASKNGSDLIVFPEMIDTGYDMNVIIEKAQEWSKGFVPDLKKYAKQYNINIVAGVSERFEQSVFNSVVIINRNGDINGSYRKSHLITANPINEDQFIKPGNELGLFEIDGISVGVMTCYEIRFPEIARSLTLLGAKIIIIPAAWPLVRLPHWQSLTRARAIENQVFVCAANRIGNDSGLPFAGNSVHIGPYGNIISEGTQIHEELIHGYYALTNVDTVRNQIKVFQDRRTEMYNQITQ